MSARPGFGACGRLVPVRGGPGLPRMCAPAGNAGPVAQACVLVSMIFVAFL